MAVPEPIVWTPAAIDAACATSHGRYKRELEERYTEYFAAHPELKGEHRWKARDLPAALPAGFEGLEQWLPESVRHSHYLSGGSSQVVALALLGAACEAAPDLRWYGELLDLPVLPGGNPQVQFEFVLDSHVLGERKDFSTTVDMLVSGDALVACGEAKYWEAGLGRCHSCVKNAPDEQSGARRPDPAETGGCSPEVRGRARYWAAAHDVLGLPERVDGQACPIAAAYQGVRNAAAAEALAEGRTSAFVLFFDERNPYFVPTGLWPGWPSYLEALFDAGNRAVEFRSCSWQRLLASGAVPDSVVKWVRVKHGLEAPLPGPTR
jgi:hypothetical protein